MLVSCVKLLFKTGVQILLAVLAYIVSVLFLLLYFYFSVKIAAGAVVCVESEIKGDVTIGKLHAFKSYLDEL